MLDDLHPLIRLPIRGTLVILGTVLVLAIMAGFCWAVFHGIGWLFGLLSLRSWGYIALGVFILGILYVAGIMVENT